MAAPTFIARINTTSGSGTSTAFTLAGISVGDIMIAILYKEATGAYSSSPSGWVELGNFEQTTGGFKYRGALWWKQYATSEPNPSWAHGSTWRGGVLTAYRGHHAADPWAVVGAADIETVQNSDPSNPGITILRSNSALLYSYWNFAGSGSAPPTGFADRGDPGVEVNTYDDLTTVTGATGAITNVVDNPEWPSTVLLELASEAAGGAPAATQVFVNPHRVLTRR